MILRDFGKKQLFLIYYIVCKISEQTKHRPLFPHFKPIYHTLTHVH